MSNELKALPEEIGHLLASIHGVRVAALAPRLCGPPPPPPFPRYRPAGVEDLRVSFPLTEVLAAGELALRANTPQSRTALRALLDELDEIDRRHTQQVLPLYEEQERRQAARRAAHQSLDGHTA